MSRTQAIGTLKGDETDELQRETKLTSHVRDTGERKGQMRKCQEPHEEDQHPCGLEASETQLEKGNGNKEEGSEGTRGKGDTKRD